MAEVLTDNSRLQLRVAPLRPAVDLLRAVEPLDRGYRAFALEVRSTLVFLW